jgi:phage terminase large subunit-like protein
MGMRANPHLMTITTAGFDKTSPCYALRTTATEILHGVKDDDSFFAIIYAMDEDNDWTDPKNWVKANPSLSVTIQEKYIAEQVQGAKNNPNEEAGVKTKNLNIWCDSANVWIPDEYLLKCAKPVDLGDFRGKECFVGVDLSSTSDLTAVSAMVRGDDDTYIYKVWYYLPESCLKDKYNKELYKIWARKGYLRITDGNVVDYDAITKDLLYINKVTQLQAVAYDKWNATQWAISATEQGLPLTEYSQAIGNFNKPTKDLERLILCGKVVIDSNPITRWCFANVIIKQDWNSNEKPTKSVNQSKIDGVIAMIQSLGAHLDYYSY